MNQENMTLLGFDYGTHSIGVAIGQTITATARPLSVIKVKDDIVPWNEVKKIIDEWRPNALVVGIPLNMDGTSQAITHKATAFKDKLNELFPDLIIYGADERLTTVEAKQQLFEKRGFRGLKKGDIDAVSAKLILESWMRVR